MRHSWCHNLSSGTLLIDIMTRSEKFLDEALVLLAFSTALSALVHQVLWKYFKIAIFSIFSATKLALNPKLQTSKIT